MVGLLLALDVLGCFLGGCSDSADDEDKENESANGQRGDGRHEKYDALPDLIGAHGDDGQNDGDGKEEKPEPENPEGKVAKEKANPSSLHGGRLDGNGFGKWWC